MSAIHTNPSVRHDIVFYIEAINTNPNGDPDNDGAPRIDVQTQHGWISGESIKRKIRDTIRNIAREYQPPNDTYRLYIENTDPLNNKHAEALDVARPMNLSETETRRIAGEWMAQKYYDIRLFGAMMATEQNCGKIVGPFTIPNAVSVSPIHIINATITRNAITKPSDSVNVGGRKIDEMGRKYFIPYGLYRCQMYFDPYHAERTKITELDLQIFWDALIEHPRHTRSSSRGTINIRGVYIFSHDCKRGRAPDHLLFDRIKVLPNTKDQPQRAYTDHTVTVDDQNLPAGVHLTTLAV